MEGNLVRSDLSWTGLTLFPEQDIVPAGEGDRICSALR